jgi:hypothetical protein
MTGNNSGVIVVRVWRDTGRLIIRVLAGTDDTNSTREWVFADVEATLACIGDLLKTLREEKDPDDTKC